MTLPMMFDPEFEDYGEPPEPNERWSIIPPDEETQARLSYLARRFPWLARTMITHGTG